MNSSLHRLIDGMVATLREEVIPQVGSEFARGQAFGLIYMLNSIRLRADWSPAFIGEQLAAQYALSEALRPLLLDLQAPELPQVAASGLSGRALEAVRDDNDGRICALIEWSESPKLDAMRVEAVEMLLRQYMDRQLKWELQTSAKPMFAEMSNGSE
ncbi:hypothetical protein [Nevskia ramosa]|uniref:hypothetical protein n=1 Tax=Nevskia ramosa TaxID=64002 RepID=UPI0012EC8540|nr:hypothetical protein [Nevskia ramosa]